MLNWLKERQARGRTARDLYGSIVTQARQPAFYARMGIPDTAQGRFEVIVLHVAAVMRRLQAEGADGQAVARLLGETFVTDMDDCMREMTFSDLAVPREVKRVAAALFDRHAALDQMDAKALAQGLETQLAYLRTDANPNAIDAQALAHYAVESAKMLAAQPAAQLSEGKIAWPDPAAHGGHAS